MRAVARLARVPESLRRPSGAALLAVAARLAPRRHQRRAIATVALAATLLSALYFLWVRDSGLVGVDEVTVIGLTSDDAGKVRAALVRAGQGMTTLHVDQDALERAVSGFPGVRAIEADADFPSRLRIEVVERPPAALLVSGERRRAVAADGTILTGLTDPGPLPEVKLDEAPPAGRLSQGAPFAVVLVLGAAPRALAPRLEDGARELDRGIVVQLSDGPELVFGDTTSLEAKWAAATRVLADPAAAGATYIDLSIPERPAAGGLAIETMAPVVPAGEEVAVGPAAPDSVPEPVPIEPQP